MGEHERADRPAEPTGDLYDPRFVSGLFDRMSASYERMSVVMSFGFSVRWRRSLVRAVRNGPPPERVVDLMCGMGETWPAIVRMFPAAELTALDFAPEMVAYARARNRDRYGGRFRVLRADALDSGLPSSSFDVVVSAYGLKTFDEAQSRRLADEVVRILRPGGRFAFIEITEPPSPVLRALYGLYLGVVVPVVGRLLVSDPVEYRMLHRYLRAYGRGERSAIAFDHPRLDTVRRGHFFGCATSFTGTRTV
jgi:ubiquinone/menaquinone biosynthesis methyltransferase